jgi:hypothetical protein
VVGIAGPSAITKTNERVSACKKVRGSS